MFADLPLMLGLVAFLGLLGHMLMRGPDDAATEAAEAALIAAGWQMTEQGLVHARLQGTRAMLTLLCEAGRPLFTLVAPDGEWPRRLRAAALVDAKDSMSILAQMSAPARPEATEPVALVHLHFPDHVLRDLQTGRLDRIELQFGLRRRRFDLAPLPAAFMRSRWFEACNAG